MENHWMKFAFLGAVVIAVLFSRMLYPGNSSTRLEASAGATIKGSDVPLFVLPTISASDPLPSPSATSTATSTSIARSTPPELEDTASLVADLGTGAIFATKDADRRWPTASITKLMTATIVLDRLDLNARVSITPDMFAVDPVDERALTIGGTYTVADLLHVMLLPSSNVAAEALATFYGRDAFIQLMNARAAEWGMTSTYFDDPSGLSASNESTANDLFRLAQKVYTDYPVIFSITRTPTYPVTNLVDGKTVTIKSINDFAGQSDFIGGKTGYTDEAAGNLLSVFRDGSEPVFVLVLGTADRFGDTQKLYNWVKANVPI